MTGKKGPLVVAISGDPVAGKSTAIKELIARYEKEGYSEKRIGKKVIVRFWAGELFRELASHAGLMVHNLTELAKDANHKVRDLRDLPEAEKEFFDMFESEELDKSIDAFIDTFLLDSIEKSREELKDCESAIIIVDSRIVGLLMKRAGEDVFNVRFSVRPEIAVERMINDVANRTEEIDEDYTFEEILEGVKKRANRDRKRFISQYSANPKNKAENAKVDIKNLGNYNLVLDTSNTGLEEIVGLLKSAIDVQIKKREALW